MLFYFLTSTFRLCLVIVYLHVSVLTSDLFPTGVPSFYPTSKLTQLQHNFPALKFLNTLGGCREIDLRKAAVWESNFKDRHWGEAGLNEFHLALSLQYAYHLNVLTNIASWWLHFNGCWIITSCKRITTFLASSLPLFAAPEKHQVPYIFLVLSLLLI